MKIQYGVCIKDSEVDKSGFIYRIEWFNTLQQAYSKWIAGNMRGEIIKSVSVQVQEAR